VLLMTTLMRLSLNVASTRVVLLEGHTGPDAAGKVIEAFGHFLVGGNYAVGIVVFVILTVINFVVITKGAGRIAEVSARFTLDAMPGKQMAIDADLNAGLIGEDEARGAARKSRTKRTSTARWTVRKFVRGDAIAGIMILLINIDRRPAHRRAAARHGAGEAARQLCAADHRRRPGGADSGADHLDCRRSGRERVGTDEDVGQQVVGQLFADPAGADADRRHPGI
jgi:flagellar biosynthesis protein FlhA